MIQPALFIPHGGGPAFFMQGSMNETFKPMENYLAHSLDSLSEKPRAILIATAHWESDPVAINGLANPRLLFDYYGFPPDTYHLKYPAAGFPQLAREVGEHLSRAKIDHRLDEERGWDHGVFIPLKVMVPNADIPVVSLSLHPSLDPGLHHRIGEAIAALRRDGVLVIGSGMSFHNLR
ncbi:MAG: class III extradiol ring-cleavage dioxygenase, partial [Alphaproteobacteria bacterium]|nr:class III extradiol ring-cleavage dioxygenase [Alphaproteobacteria bacterium]